MILAIVDDLLFRSKLEAAATQLGTPLTIASVSGQVPRPGAGWSRVLIDLNGSRGDALAMIRALRAAHPGTPVIGYCSHVQRDLQRQALEAGCTQVLPRSAFVQQLPELLTIGK
jgi:DNA-binding NarL/FixJ family response regulator